jgi:GT2 family glycosyltransferase
VHVDQSIERGAQRPPVTVLIPAYNLASYLQDAVASVLKQTYGGPLIIIILDDGSRDETLSIATSLAQRATNITVYSQSNQGRVATRNRLLSFAQTELVAWIDGDDMAAPTWIEDQFQLLTSEPMLVAVSGQGYAMSAEALPIGPLERPLTSHDIEQRHLNGQANAFFQSCVLTKRSAVNLAGGYRDKYPAGEDYDLWLRMSEVGRLANLDICHLYYRVHATSANSTVSVEQRLQGFAAANEARAKRGLPLLNQQIETTIPPPQKDDWNRRIYWINIALRSGNPRTAALLLKTALAKHPRSWLLWCLMLVAIADSLLLGGNRTRKFMPGEAAHIGCFPWFSVYRCARAGVRFKRRIFSR